MSPARERALLWALAAGNFVIGNGVMMATGLMNVLVDAFSLSAPRAGMLVWLGAITMGIGAPLLAQLASRVDRRRLLVGALALYVVGHLASAACTSFEQLLVARVITVLGAAVFTPQAAAAVGVLLPPHRRASGVTFAFLGWSVASAAGMPLGSWLGAELGWRAAYLVEASLALAAACAVAATLPARVYAPAVSLQTWREVARRHALVIALAVTVVQMAGQFVLSTYQAPELRRKLGASPAQIAMLFSLFGLCGVVGNVAIARLVQRLDASRALVATLGLMVGGLLVWWISGGSIALVMAAMVLWGLGGFASNSLQQARLISIAPALAPATVALNSSGLYLGQAMGAATGGFLLSMGRPDALALAAAAVLVVAIGMVIAGERAQRAARPVGAS